MGNIEKGYYWIKYTGFILPARWDGEKWNHEKGSHSDSNQDNIIGPINFSCPAGCTCTVNPDGSVNVDCTPK